MILGYVEHVQANLVSGWAADSVNPMRRCQLRLLLSGNVIAETAASIERADVARHFGLFDLPETIFGFGFAPPPGLDPAQLEVEVNDGADWKLLRRLDRPPRYQNFDGRGASESDAKLAALHLEQIEGAGDPPLRGKRVLDLGCNEGFFCREAVRQGAALVVGVDTMKLAIDSARRRVPEAEFIHASWWEIRDQQFDVILFLSAVHYEPDPGALLRHLATLLAPGGTLVLECGVRKTRARQGWEVVNRADGPFRYPTQAYIGTLLAGYAWRYIGPSVTQRGDPVDRNVYHCRRRRPSVILLHGESGTGKSGIARAIGREGNVYAVDSLLEELFNRPRFIGLPIYQAITATHQGAHFTSAKTMFAEIRALGLLDAFLDLMVMELPLDLDVTLVEGEALSDPQVRALLADRLRAHGARCWEMGPAGA